MVFDCPLEKPYLSYVRVNLNSSPIGTAPAGNVPGIGESVKCNLIKTMLRSDPQVVNAALLHKCMVEQEEPIPKPSVPLWTPEHLYASGEKRLLRYSKMEWKEIRTEESPIKTETSDVQQSAPLCVKSGRKRRSEETATGLKSHSLEHAKTEMKNRVNELEMRIELMSKIMRDPKKLSLLMAHLQELRCAKVARVSTPRVQN